MFLVTILFAGTVCSTLALLMLYDYARHDVGIRKTLKLLAAVALLNALALFIEILVVTA